MAANIRCIMRAKAPYGQGITKMKVKLTPEQSSTPSLMPETESVYLRRATEGTGELMELVGGSVAWNQLCNSSSVTIPSGHKYYMVKGGVKSIGASTGSAITGLTSGTDMVIDLTSYLTPTIADYVYSLEQATAGSGIAWLQSYGFFTEDYYAYSAPTLQSVEALSHIAKDGNGNVISTTTFGTTTLRGILKTDENGNLYYDGDTYEWDGAVMRRFAEYNDLTVTAVGQNSYGLPFATVAKASGAPAKAYNVTTIFTNMGYEAVATNPSTGDKKIRSLSGSNWSVYDSRFTDLDAAQSLLSGLAIINELATPVTESADPFTAVQTVEDGGTEEFTTSNGVPVGVKGRFANAVPMEGVDSFTVTANDGTTHTYPVTLSEEIYRGYVDMLTGEATSDMASIAEYNGETISTPWLSSLDVYSLGATPTKGAQVVYPITPEEVTAAITGDPSTLSGVVSATSTEGTVDWSELSEIGIKCIMKRKNPFQ